MSEQELQRYDSPATALNALLARLASIPTEQVPLHIAAGMVLAESVYADRDSPPCDTSAMDGYAIRLSDLRSPTSPIVGQIRIGQASPSLPKSGAMHIVTGAPVPAGVEAVVRIEDTEMVPEGIRLRIPAESIRMGQNIRRKGENIASGSEILPAGTLLHPAAVGSLATFGVAKPRVFRKLRIGVLTTGDEVVDAQEAVEPWQIRNSNAASLQALLSGSKWRSMAPLRHASDDPRILTSELNRLLDSCDLVILTGGVSMGDRDYVPQTVRDCGCNVVFHKLPIRPGKPILGAVGPQGQAVLALPGNPVSVLTTAVRFGGAVCRKLGGIQNTAPPLSVALSNPDQTVLKLWHARPVRLLANGVAELLSSRGSGDIAAAARSDGFVELPPGESGAGPWPFYRWEI